MSAWPPRHRHRRAPLLTVLLTLGGIGLLPAHGSGAQAPARLMVAVTVPPQAWLVRRLGGDRVDVAVLLPPGASPHTYDPTPQQIAHLAAARLVVEVGHPSFLFERRLLEVLRSRDPAPLVVDMTSAAGRVMDSSDPHVWLSPAVMRATAHHVKVALTVLDPRGEPLYRERLAAVLADIDHLDADLRRTLAGLPHRRFLVYHPAWGYLARDYDLEQVAIEAEGKEPSPRQLVALVEQARREGTRVVFVQTGYYDRPARAVAGEIGARVVAVDPMAEDWPANLRRVATLLHDTLAQGAGGG